MVCGCRLGAHLRPVGIELIGENGRDPRVGSLAELDAGLEAGFYLSVNPAMTRSEKGRTIIGRLPRDRALIESDGPYARVAGRPLEPRDVSIAAEYLGTVWAEPPHAVSTQLAINLRRLCDGL